MILICIGWILLKRNRDWIINIEKIFSLMPDRLILLIYPVFSCARYVFQGIDLNEEFQKLLISSFYKRITFALFRSCIPCFYFENSDPTPRNMATHIRPLTRKNRNPMIPILLIHILSLFIIGLLPGKF